MKLCVKEHNDPDFTSLPESFLTVTTLDEKSGKQNRSLSSKLWPSMTRVCNISARHAEHVSSSQTPLNSVIRVNKSIMVEHAERTPFSK